MSTKKSEEKCEVCNLVLSAANAVGHYNGKKHQRKLEQSQKQMGVFITGFPEGKKKEDILQYFSEFGSIKKTRVGPTLKYMIIQYENKDEVDKVINTQHIIGGKTLIVEKQNICTQSPKEDHHEGEMLRLIRNVPSLDTQINRFIEYVTPDLNFVAGIYHRINCDMAEAMQGQFPCCVVYPFGSATTSLQFKTSDLDIFIDIDDDTNSLQRARKALFISRHFENIFVLSSAKIPIVRCVHCATRIKCDINFKSMLGVKNSELIRYFISLDGRVRPFILVVKFWAKIHEITGSNHLFTNYSIVMMCIFYLQQVYSFPSVRVLQRGTHPTNPRIIWNMNFSQAAMYTKPNPLNTSLLSLLRGFFAFYAKFDYDTFIISPYLGKRVEKKLFLTKDTVPEEFIVYKNNQISTDNPLKCDTPICLQDPLEHNANTCKIIFPNILKKYVTMCGVAESILMQENETGMLHKLFTNENNLPNTFSHICLKPNILNEKSEDFQKLWLVKIKKFISTVFEDILKLNMTQEINAKAQKLNEQEDVHQREQTIKYRANCSADLWTGRDEVSKKISQQLESCENALEREILISTTMWNDASSKTPDSSMLFECFIDVSFHKKPTRVNINFSPIEKNGVSMKSFNSFHTFCISTLCSWYEKYEA